ncbi:MAG: hypothetical protein J5482_02930 [Oscillospiraceae bacterium]|nr:hypothetical protein [Oscillospiraceae bacterium]
MALLPNLKLSGGTAVRLDVFGGIDRTAEAREGTWREETNLTARDYPALATRSPRRYLGTLTAPGGMTAKDAVAWVDDGKLYYNGTEVLDGLSTGEKHLVSMGAYLLIFPDGKWINTQKLTETGNIDNAVTVSGGVRVCLCDATAQAYTYTEGAIAPLEPQDGARWLDTGGEEVTLKEWSESNQTWYTIVTVYVKLSGTNIAAGFSQYDGVQLAGLTGGAEVLNGNRVIYGAHHDAETPGNDYIITVGLITGGAATVSEAVTVSRKAPVMDYVIECDNRLWGCKYGVVNGEALNEIYASKLGDFKNWNCFMGLSTDSYAAARGSDGVFTGAITYLGHPLFFREDCIEKLYPSASGAHQIVTVAARGVQKGCYRSLAIVGETLYYKSRDGVCAYTGSLPASVGQVLGDRPYSDARAGAVGELYYLSMCDGDSRWHLFTCDTRRGIWHREDDTCALCFAAMDGRMYWIDETTRRIICADDTDTDLNWYGTGTAEDMDETEWSAESGVIGYETTENKYVRRFVIRAETEGRIHLELRYDESPWEDKGTWYGDGLRSFVLPVSPRRCDHLRIRISGTGACRIYSIAKYIEKGSDVSRR